MKLENIGYSCVIIHSKSFKKIHHVHTTLLLLESIVVINIMLTNYIVQCIHHYYAVPTIPPLNSTGSAVNSTAIIINWQLPAPYGRNGIITGYSLILTELITNTTTSYSQTGAHIELVIGSLHPFYDYECIIAAETSVGRGPYGDPFITRTSPDGMDEKKNLMLNFVTNTCQ